MRSYLLPIFIFLLTISCSSNNRDKSNSESIEASVVKEDFIFAWDAYKKYAWGHDVLLPLSKSYHDWYEESLYISPIDAYGTLKLMNLEDEVELIERFVIDSLDFDKDIFVKTFEVNIRILGGLLSMYQSSNNEEVLKKAEDFGDRMLKAFDSETGIPHYWFNLKTGEVKGDTVNIAEAGTYTFEMGILSYFTGNPIYYRAARDATLAVFERRSALGLIGEVIDIESGEWINETSHICAGIDSYYEYMYKTWHLFRDPVMKDMWDKSIEAVNTYLPERKDTLLWYSRVNMHSGKKVRGLVTLYDAFMPALLAISGDIERAVDLQETWNWLWNQYGLEPTVYDYDLDQATYPVYDLNPEIIESAYYLYHFTSDNKYREMAEGYYRDIVKYCKTDIAFTAVKNVETKEQKDYMATYFFAETMKYFYLIFSEPELFDFDSHIFSTEAHVFRLNDFDSDRIKTIIE